MFRVLMIFSVCMVCCYAAPNPMPDSPPEEANSEDSPADGVDVTTIDAKTGPQVPFDNGDNYQKPKDSETMTEVEINKMLGYKEEELLFVNQNVDGSAASNTPLWPTMAGRLHIPYEISTSFALIHQNKIRHFIQKMNSYINCNTDTWKPRTSSDTHYVKFVTGNGCSGYIGRRTAKSDGLRTYQPIILHTSCIDNNQGTVLHYMLHTMGFYHEHQRTDRDTYVRINSENILSAGKKEFAKLTSSHPKSLLTPYDYESLMHYSKTEYSSNGKDTITPLKFGATIGQRDGMSFTDIDELNLLYGCKRPVFDCGFGTRTCELRNPRVSVVMYSLNRVSNIVTTTSFGSGLLFIYFNPLDCTSPKILSRETNTYCLTVYYTRSSYFAPKFYYGSQSRYRTAPNYVRNFVSTPNVGYAGILRASVRIACADIYSFIYVGAQKQSPVHWGELKFHNIALKQGVC